MQWKAGSVSTFAINARDTAAANLDFDVPWGFDTMIRTIVSTNQTFMGKSNVAIYRDSSTRTRKSTLGHMTQDADGTVWIYNFGQDIWQNYFTSAGKTISDIGWIKYYDASNSANWFNNIDIGTFVNGYDTYVVYSETRDADETILVSGKSYMAKHTLHTITTSSTGYTSFFTIYIDSYLVFDLGGPAKEIVHSYTDWINKEHPGSAAHMIAYQ
jgi:hypothetical protein